MADYFQVKNQNIFNPPANTSLGNATNQFNDVYVQNDLVLGNVTVTGDTIIAPRITTITYPGDDTAADTAGGQTITLTGTGFVAGANILINGSAVGVVSVVSSTTITFTSPANATGSYVIYVINPDGSTAIAIPGIQYSGTPTWTTAAGTLGNVYETDSFTQTVTATGDAPITYSVVSGSLPPGSTFNANGTITGTSQLSASPTTYSFTVRATDAQLQDTNRAFSIAVIPDVVTWSSPANNTTYSPAANTAIANITLSATSAVGSGITYSANTLPTGLSLTGANISGTPTVQANTSSLLTATANTTSESSSITINWVVSVASDPYFMYNSLLLSGNGSNGAQNNTFLDSSTNNFTITRAGNTTQGTYSPYGGNWSNYLDGTSGQYLNAPANTAFSFGTGDFTIEGWVFPTGTNTGAPMPIVEIRSSPTNTTGFAFMREANALTLNVYQNGYKTASTNSLTLNTWNHVALVRSSNTWAYWINGVSSGSFSNSTNLTDGATTGPKIGGSSTAGEVWIGYLSNIRIVKGTAVYTSNFTPSTTPLTAVSGTSLLTCQSNRFIDNSTNAFAITASGTPSVQRFSPFEPASVTPTSYSGYFNGSSNYLSFTDNVAFQMGTGDFTVEAWVNPSSLPASDTRIWSYQTAGPGTVFNIYLLGTGSSSVFAAELRSSTGTNDVQTNGTTSAKVGTWYHVAFTRASGTTKLFVNGVQEGTTQTSQTQSLGAGVPSIGVYLTGNSNYFPGYISNFRIVKGTAVYTANFTPSTTPLTAISGTSLLTLQSPTFIDNSTNNFTLTVAGNTQPTIQNPFGYTSATTEGYTVSTIGGSGYFDGNGDYLDAGTNAVLGFGTGDFTVEAWIYRNATGTFPVYTNGPASAGSFAFYIVSDVVRVDYYGGSGLAGTTVVALNTWNHVAVIRSGSTLSVYLNGNRDATTTTSSNNTTSNGVIGRDWTNSTGYSNGYISNARVVKGTAVYTSNFVPPAAPLTAITNTSLLLSGTNAGIYDAAMMNNMETVGNAQISTAQTKFGSGSMYFDGTGDYLVVSPNVTNNLNTGDFTIEAWVYLTSGSTYQFLIGSGDNSAGYMMIGINVPLSPTSTIAIGRSGINWPVQFGAGTTITSNTWTHIAITRSGTTNRAFVNGTQLGSNVTDSTSWSFPSNTLWIGNQSGGAAFNGYIDDLRITKGYARYTSNFTPPTSAFPTY